MANLTQNKFLTDSEINTLKENLKTESNKVHVLMIELALYTGARSAEILEVTTEDFDNGAVVIYGKKNSNNRTIPLPAKFAAKLQRYAKTLANKEKLFPVTTRTFRRAWDRVKPNVDKSLHSLRHTMGVKLYNNCEDLHTVKTMLGHKQVTNTMVYLDYVEGSRKLKTSIDGMWSNKLDHVA